VSLLWVKNKDGAWVDHALDNDFVAIGPDATISLVAPDARGSHTGTLLVRSGDTHGLDRWVLICSPGSRTRVNGVRLPIGVRVLVDRDAIDVGDCDAIDVGDCDAAALGDRDATALGDRQVLFFSSEQLAQVLPFPGKDDHTSCIRCKLPLESGTPAVRCPAPECGFWHHQSDDQSCWTYTAACASCGHPTAFDADFQWSPWEL
jgi:hypothetical protein